MEKKAQIGIVIISTKRKPGKEELLKKSPLWEGFAGMYRHEYNNYTTGLKKLLKSLDTNTDI